MGRWLETYQTPEEILMAKIKSISLKAIAKFKSENPDFGLDFESFVKELCTDDMQLHRMLEILLKDSYKKKTRGSRSTSSAPATGSPAGGEAQFAMLIQQHQQQRLIATRNGPDSEPVRETTIDGTRYRIFRSRSPVDIEAPERVSRPSSSYEIEEVRRMPIPIVTTGEEDKEDDGHLENREIGLGTVLAA